MLESAMVLLVVCASAAPGAAFAQSVSNCAAADSPYGVALNCSSVCTISGADVTCDTTTRCTGGAGDSVNALGVRDFNSTGNHDFEVWGRCSTSGQFCCALDDSAAGTFTTITLIGTSEDDDLYFTDGVSENMANHRTYHVDGFIRGGDGDDVIGGSDHIGNGYRDNLYGDDGDDSMFGEGDGDWMDGGAGNDTMSGNGGDDHMIGGDGDDYLAGGSGSDAVCDSADNLIVAGCVTSGGTELHGDADTDIVYYSSSAGCAASTPNGSSGCEAPVNDVWGDTTFFARPNNCEVSQAASYPTACIDPN
jgi:Ca2+-binding RTX toxin-like protein